VVNLVRNHLVNLRRNRWSASRGM